MATPRFSVCEISTLNASFEEDLAAYREGGAEGIGICEFKLPADGNDAPALSAFRASGLAASICVPATLSILPLPSMSGPAEPAERVAALCASLRRLTPFQPASCVCLTGPRGGLQESEARRLVVDGLRRIARTAGELGMRVALEPVHSSIRDDWTLVSSIPETLELLAEVGEPDVGILFDVWHLWDTPNIFELARLHAKRIAGVHINDWQKSSRGWKDRALPGEGVANLPAILGALEAGGYHGWYDLEIFSDDGSFGDNYPDSLWKVPPVEVVRRGRDGFLRAWTARH